MTRTLLALILAATAAACGLGSPPLPLTGTYASPEALAAAVLDGLANGDRAVLEQIAVSEAEFREYVWPELPASRPERNLPFSYVWGDLRQKSALGLDRTLREQAGRQYVVQRVKYSGETTDYRTFRVHRAAVFVVRDAGGQTFDLRVVGSLFERDGAWKVFSYVADD